MRTEPDFLDSNVFLYAAGAEHPLREPARVILRRVGAGVRDAIHAGTLRTHGLARIITADGDFDDVPGVVRVRLETAASTPVSPLGLAG